MGYISCKNCGDLVPESNNICPKCNKKIDHSIGYYFRSAFSWLIKLAIVGGVAFAAYRYAPDFHKQLYQRNTFGENFETDSLMNQSDSLQIQNNKVKPKYKKNKR